MDPLGRVAHPIKSSTGRDAANVGAGRARARGDRRGTRPARARTLIVPRPSLSASHTRCCCCDYTPTGVLEYMHPVSASEGGGKKSVAPNVVFAAKKKRLFGQCKCLCVCGVVDGTHDGCFVVQNKGKGWEKLLLLLLLCCCLKSVRSIMSKLCAGGTTSKPPRQRAPRWRRR